MKNIIKLLSLALVTLFAVIALTACGGPSREDYIEELEALDRTDLATLESWLAENDENITELFNVIHHDYVDIEGQTLNYDSQVADLDMDFFVSWDVFIGENLFFTQVWDYAASVVAGYIEQVEALDNTDLEALNNWLSENSRNLNELFDIEHHYVDMEGEALDYAAQVSRLDIEAFVSWSLDVGGSGDRLTFTHTWDFIPITAADFIGSWEGASSRHGFSRPIGPSKYLEFLEDGTTRHISYGGTETTSIWELTSNGILLVGGTEFMLEISMGGRLLTFIDDSGRREKRFERIDEIPTQEEDDDDDEEDNETADNHSIVGEWNWTATNTWFYTFNANGTGEMYSGTDFTWRISGNELAITIIPGFPARYEWEISGNTLTLSSLDIPGADFIYTRR